MWVWYPETLKHFSHYERPQEMHKIMVSTPFIPIGTTEPKSMWTQCEGETSTHGMSANGPLRCEFSWSLVAYLTSLLTYSGSPVILALYWVRIFTPYPNLTNSNRIVLHKKDLPYLVSTIAPSGPRTQITLGLPMSTVPYKWSRER